jgi:hypothetical protein
MASNQLPQNPMASVGQAASETSDKVGKAAASAVKAVGNASSSAIKAAKDASGKASSFLESDGILAKFSFVALLVIVLYISVRIISKIMMFFYNRKAKSYLYKDLKSANIRSEILQDPSNPNSVLIERSKNREDGIEFTYSSWIFIQDLGSNQNKFLPVFVKANFDNYLTDCPTNNKDTSLIKLLTELQDTKTCSGLNYPDNGPGLYIYSNKDPANNVSSLNLLVVMNTYNSIMEYVIVKNISTQKWLNVIIRVSGQNLDIYVNGTIVKRHIFDSPPKQNYGSVVINGNKGFNGSVSGIKYYNKALNIVDINNIVKQGPNMRVKKNELVKPPFLSQDWYFNNDTI